MTSSEENFISIQIILPSRLIECPCMKRSRRLSWAFLMSTNGHASVDHRLHLLASLLRSGLDDCDQLDYSVVLT